MRDREALLRLAASPPDSGFIPTIEIRQAELGMTHSQAELGNDRVDGESVGGGGVVFGGGGMHFGALHMQDDEAGVQGVRQGVVVYRSSGNNAV